MRKFYSLVLLATALLIGTNAWAVYPAGWLQDQFDAIEADGQTHTITMEDDITLTAPVYLGTKTVDEERKSIILDMNGHHITMSATDWVDSHPNVFCHMFIITHGELLVHNNASDKATNPSLIQMTGTSSGKYNDIFTVTGSYKSSRWQKSGDAYVINESDAINTRDEGRFTHLEIGEGVKLYAPNTVSGAGITMDGYHANNKALVSSSEYATGTFGSTGLNLSPSFKANYICLYGRSDAPAYNTAILNSATRGVAYGLRVDVYGDIEFATASTSGKSYGIKLNGDLRSSLTVNEIFQNQYCWPMDQAYAETYGATAAPTTNETKSFSIYGTTAYTNHKLDTIDAPFLYVRNSAHITAAAELNEATAVYCSGYGKALIEGACSGNSGVNVKSGRVELHDAEITCTASDYSQADEGNHATGSGGVIVNSVENRAGGIEVIISGDTKVSTTVGYAIEETVNKTTGGSDVSSIAIQGGTIEGGTLGAIALTTDTKNTTEVTGGNIAGTATVGGTTVDVSDLVPNTNEYHTTEVEVNGKTVIVVTQGGAPQTQDPTDPTVLTPWSWCAHNDQSGKSVAWTKIEDAEIASGTVTLDELQIISGSTGNLQQLTIKDGAALEVNQLTMNDYARIIVEAGGKLIVKGTQGIVAGKVENIVLESDFQTKKYATFLFNPAVSSNKHPNATVEFGSYSFYQSSSNYQSQRFGVPTWKAVTSIKNDVPGLRTRIQYWGANGWENLGEFIQGTSEFANINRLNKPFDCYIFMSYQNDPGAKYTMTGKLVGNVNNVISTGFRFTPFANSYTADLDIVEMLNNMTFADEANDKWIYIAAPNGNNGYSWQAVDENTLSLYGAQGYATNGKIAPLQPFIMHITGDWAEDHELNYEKMVWDPVMDPTHAVANGAPRRAASISDNTAKLRVVVSNEQGELDDVKMIESTSITKRAEKYMNDDVNIYAHTDVNSAVIMNDNLEDTYFGFSTVNGGEFTISFDNVEGREFDLIDLETGVKVAVKEGETYSFAAAANTVADYRFKLVERAKLPTAIENTEAVKSVKGIYTITGQYLGEMNVWNTLPAGVYVVNGEKCVK